MAFALAQCVMLTAGNNFVWRVVSRCYVHDHTNPSLPGLPVLSADSGSDQAWVAINMIILCIMIPQVWGLILAIWKHCYKANRTNPNPTIRAILWTLLDVFIESAGVTLFSLRVATKVHGAVVVVMLSAIFGIPAFKKVQDAWRAGLRREGSSEEQDPLLSKDDFADEPLNDTIRAAERKVARRPSILGRILNILALIVQAGSPVYIPVLIRFLDDTVDWQTPVLAVRITSSHPYPALVTHTLLSLSSRGSCSCLSQ